MKATVCFTSYHETLQNVFGGRKTQLTFCTVFGPMGHKDCKFFKVMGLFHFNLRQLQCADLRKAMKAFKLKKAALSDVAVV